MNVAPSVSCPEPQSPFAEWPRHHCHAEFGFAWVTSPCAVVVQVLPERGTVAVATWVQDLMDEVLSANPEAVEQAGGLLVVQDWRRLTSYDPAGRVEFMRRARSRPSGLFRQSAIVLSDHVSPLVPMAISAGAVFMSMFMGMAVSQYRDIERALAEHHVGPPSARPAFPRMPVSGVPGASTP